MQIYYFRLFFSSGSGENVKTIFIFVFTLIQKDSDFMKKQQINKTKSTGVRMAFLLFSFFFVACGKEKRSDRKGEKMQDFIVGISKYARSQDADFIVIPQNGVELAFNSLDAESGVKGSFMDAIDGFGVEELFYNGALAVDDYRLKMCQEIQKTKKVLVADYLNQLSDEADVIQRNLNEGFICFPRRSTNYDYFEIPQDVINENSLDVNKLADAKNYLYLISSNLFTSKQEMLTRLATTNFDAIIIDAFFGEELWTAAEISQMKTKANGGKRLVLSYMSIGSAEKYRYYWKDDWKLHKPRWLKKAYEGYEDEIWVKFWKKEWQDIIFGNDNSYTKKIINAGFDGVYLDNVEAFYFLYFND